MSKYRSQRTRYAVQYNKLYRIGHRLTVPALGDMRRVRALRRIGYSSRDIAEGTGLSASHVERIVNDRLTRIGLAPHRRIVAFYNAHMARPRTDAAARKTITYAKKFGWYPPFAWDDIDSLDDMPTIHARREDAA